MGDGQNFVKNQPCEMLFRTEVISKLKQLLFFLCDQILRLKLLSAAQTCIYTQENDYIFWFFEI